MPTPQRMFLNKKYVMLGLCEVNAELQGLADSRHSRRCAIV
jgi:hypothetical protein